MEAHRRPEQPFSVMVQCWKSLKVFLAVSVRGTAGFCGMLKLLRILPDTEVSQTKRTDPYLRPLHVHVVNPMLLYKPL